MNPVTDPALLEILNGGGQQQGGPVYGPPPVVDPLDGIRAQTAQQQASTGAMNAETSRMNAELARQEAARKAAEAAEAKKGEGQGDATARAKLIATVGKLAQIGKDADDNKGWGETGFWGGALRDTKGTAAYSLGKDLDTARARFAFDALQAMRDASKTGGALGQVTERELALLESATAAIDPNMDHDTFMRNVEEARQAYLSKLAMVDPQVATRLGYDANKAEQAWMGINDTYAAELGYIDQPLTVDRSASTPTQEYPDDIDAIMQKYGGN